MIVVSNTAATPVTADVFLDFRGKRYASAPLTFEPHETKPLSIAGLLAGLNLSPSQAPEGGISIVPRSPQPSLIAQGRITDPLGGFSSGLSFHDPAHQLASALHANGVPIGVPSPDSPYARMGTFVPHVIVRNLQATPQTVTITVEYAGAKGTEQVVLPPLTLAGYTSQETTLESVMGELPLPLPFCSVRIQHGGPAGSVVAAVSSLEISGNSAIDSPVANEGDGWAGSGSHAWHLDEHTESVLFLTNESEKECPIGVQVHAHGVAYQVPELSLKPRETRAIDLRKLRDAQQADLRGHKIPAGATDGIVRWTRLAKLPVMGQMEVVQPAEAMASPDFEGGDPCPPCYAGSRMVPTQSTLIPTHTSSFYVEGDFQDCNEDDEYSVVSGGDWWSWNPAVASVSNVGQVTGVSGGSTTIEDDFTVLSCDPCGPCDCEYVDDSDYGTVNVCSLSISSPSSGAVFSLGGSNYNQATVPLQASSACSGTVNWTLNYTYTSLQPATYTATGSTSGTIGQTKNYTTAVGTGGQVAANAQSTLQGHNFNSSVTLYVPGTTIPDPTITNRLVALYTSGATPHLLTGIAWQESSYRQFEQKTLYGISGRWPIESPVPALGQFVGMMQVPNGMVNAFDWLTNTQQGANTFQSKLTDAGNYVANLRSQNPQLPALSGVGLENEALSRYGGFSTRYYTVNASGNGWVTTTRTDLLAYVSTIRNNMR